MLLHVVICFYGCTVQGGSGGVIHISDSVVEGHLSLACSVGILSAACVSAGCAPLLLLGGQRLRLPLHTFFRGFCVKYHTEVCLDNSCRMKSCILAQYVARSKVLTRVKL